RQQRGQQRPWLLRGRDLAGEMLGGEFEKLVLQIPHRHRDAWTGIREARSEQFHELRRGHRMIRQGHISARLLYEEGLQKLRLLLKATFERPLFRTAIVEHA
ncbi:MAG: hypothetical protein ACK55I_17685, partial [bacterium]